jgi:hypothetical protein
MSLRTSEYWGEGQSRCQFSRLWLQLVIERDAQAGDGDVGRGSVGGPASRQHRSSPPEQPARQGAGVLAAVDHHCAVDDHRPDARRILVRVVVGRPIDDCRGVEQDHVGRLAFRQEAAVLEAKRRRSSWRSPGAS